MIPRLLDKEFLPLKPTFKHLRLSEAGRKFSVPGMEIFRPACSKIFNYKRSMLYEQPVILYKG